MFLLMPLTITLALAISACNPQASTTQSAANVDRDKLARWVTRFLDVTIGPNDAGTSYILIGETPENIRQRLPKDTDIIGTVVDTRTSQTQSLVDIPLSQAEVIGHFRTDLNKDGWEERSPDGDAPDPAATTGPFVFCAQDTSLIAIAYDTEAPREGFTSTLVTTLAPNATGSPCAGPSIRGTATPGVNQTPAATVSPASGTPTTAPSEPATGTPAPGAATPTPASTSTTAP
jgi:hypothetical protein